MTSDNSDNSDIQEEIEEYKKYLSENNHSDQTVTNYTGRVKSFYSNRDEVITAQDLKETMEEEESQLILDLERFVTSRNDSYAMKSYIEYIKKINTSNTILRHHLSEIQDSHLEYETSGRSGKSSNKEKIFPADIIEEIIEEAPKFGNLSEDELRLYLKTMYLTAGRNDDIARLEWRDVFIKRFKGKKIENDPKFIIHKDRSKSKNTGVVEVSEDVWNKLIQLSGERKNVENDDYVFFPDETRDQRSIHKKINYIFGKASEKLGFVKGEQPTPHCFRHSRLTHMGKEMLDDKEYPEIRQRLADYGRHNDESTTEIYIEAVREESKEDLQKYSTVEF